MQPTEVAPISNYLSIVKVVGNEINEEKALVRILSLIEYILTEGTWVCHNSVIRNFLVKMEDLESRVLNGTSIACFTSLKADVGHLFKLKYLSTKNPDFSFPTNTHSKAYLQRKELDYMFLKHIDDERIALMKYMKKLRGINLSVIDNILSASIAEAHKTCPCILYIVPYLKIAKMTTREFALIRMIIISFLLQTQFDDILGPEFMFGMEEGKFRGFLNLFKTFILKQTSKSISYQEEYTKIGAKINNSVSFEIFDVISSTNDVEDVIWYVNSLRTLSHELGTDFDIDDEILSIVDALGLCTSSRLSDDNSGEMMKMQLERVITSLHSCIANLHKTNIDTIRAICSSNTRLIEYMEKYPIHETNRFNHANALQLSLIKRI